MSDGASVNGTMMSDISVKLAAQNIEFDATDRRIIWISHILHICITHILKGVGQDGAPRNVDDTESNTGNSKITKEDDYFVNTLPGRFRN